VLALAGCSSAGSGSGPAGQSAGAEQPSPTAKPPVVSVAGAAAELSFSDPVKLEVSDGEFDSVQVVVADGEQALDGAVSADHASWSSQEPPKPGTAYQVTASVKDSSGKLVTSTLTLKTAAVPASQKVSFTVTPDDGEKVGIGQAIQVRFLVPITEKAAVEKRMTVDATNPSGQPVTGSWSWLNSQEVHWRPQKFWTPGTTVKLDMKLAGVKAAKGRYGRKDYSQTFTIGASHITKVDAAKHRMTIYRDGKLVDTWLTGTGKRGLETYSGTYVVLNKSPVVQMDSCSARITCDKKDPDYYDEKEFWATRLTRSGTFIHAASWDPVIGKQNISHGCIHLSDANAKEYFGHAVPGDVVIVSRTGRGPQERIKTQDPGLYDWNIPWSTWVKGSALG